MSLRSVVIDLKSVPKRGYATTLIRFKQADKDVVDNAAALCKMSRASFTRAVLFGAASQIIEQHEKKR